jgi:hypothetical protein
MRLRDLEIPLHGSQNRNQPIRIALGRAADNVPELLNVGARNSSASWEHWQVQTGFPSVNPREF